MFFVSLVNTLRGMNLVLGSKFFPFEIQEQIQLRVDPLSVRDQAPRS